MSLLSEEKNRATEAEVLAVPEPAFTRSWHPVSHAKVIDALDAVVADRGLRVINKEYSLSGDGRNVFGVWDVCEMGDVRYSVGLRNSLCKTFALGIVAGSRILVCDNLAFDGEFIEFRKHTSGLNMDELFRIADQAIKNLIPQVEEFIAWQMGLKERALPVAHHKILTYNAMSAGALPPSKFHEFQEAYELEQQVDDNGRCVYAFHGAVTRVMRGQSLAQVTKKNAALNRVINGYCNFIDVHK